MSAEKGRPVLRGEVQTVANLKFHKPPPPPRRANWKARPVPSPLSPAAGRPLALEKRRRPRDCILFHVAGTPGPETKQHAQGRTISRQQLPYKIGRLSPSRALDPVKTTCVFPFLPREGEIQACNNTGLLFSPGQKSKLESDKSEISAHFLIGLHGLAVVSEPGVPHVVRYRRC